MSIYIIYTISIGTSNCHLKKRHQDIKPDKAGESTLPSRSGGEKGLR